VTPFVSGLVAGLLCPVLHFGMSASKRRLNPFRSIKKYRGSGRRASASDTTALSKSLAEADRRADFWQLENSPFLKHRDIDLSLFRSEPVRDRLQGWSPSASDPLRSTTDTEKSAPTSRADRVMSNGNGQSEIADKNEAESDIRTWPSPLDLLAEEELSYILVDEEGRPMRNSKPRTPGSSHDRS
jgi:hypothetical protein